MIERKFIPGSEWLYLKIYTGVKTSDVILQEIITSISDMIEEKLIIKWFFIRYSDPKHHLRLRFHLADVSKYKIVLTKLNQSLRDFIDSGEIANIVIDSYTREIERYGELTIEYAEELFYKNSVLVINFIEYDDEEKIMVSMFYFDRILSDLELSNEDKIKLVSRLNKSFKAEFNADKKFNSQLDKKFRMFKPKYAEFITSIEFSEIRNLIISNISTTSLYIEGSVICQNKITIFSQPNFFESIYHMHINRTFISNQRLFEMIVYDYLNRYYKIQIQ